MHVKCMLDAYHMGENDISMPDWWAIEHVRCMCWLPFWYGSECDKLLCILCYFDDYTDEYDDCDFDNLLKRRRRTYCLERSELGLVVKDVKPGVLVQTVVTLVIWLFLSLIDSWIFCRWEYIRFICKTKIILLKLGVYVQTKLNCPLTEYSTD